jgi:hypothetical protein
MNPRSGGQLGFFEEGPEQTWSYSRLKSLRRCALEYKVRWMEGKQALFQPGHIEVQAGRVLHHIVREYYRSPVVPEPHRILLEIYKRLAPVGPAWRDDLQGEPRVLRALQLFADSPAARLRAAGLEIGCKAQIGDHWFTGQADLIFHVEERPSAFGLLEFKLTDVEVRAEDVAERYLQCLIYFLGLPPQFSDSTERLGIYVFDSGRYENARLEQGLVDRAIRIVETSLQQASGPDFPPTLNAFCPSCGYQTLCPAYSKAKSR